MPPQISLGFDWPGQEKKRRQEKASDLAQHLYENTDLSSEEIARVRDNFIRTGNLDIPREQPTGRMTELSRQETSPGHSYQKGKTIYSFLPDVEVQETPEMAPVRQGKRFGAEIRPGVFSEIPEMRGMDNIARLSRAELPAKTNGEDIFLDPVTRKIVNRVPNGRPYNTTKIMPKVDGPDGAGGRGPGETSQQKAWRSALAEADQAEKAGKMTMELSNRAAQAAEGLGFQTEDVPAVTVPWYKPGQSSPAYKKPTLKPTSAGGSGASPAQPGADTQDRVTVETSDGQVLLLPRKSLGAAKKRDPGLKVR